MSSIQSLQKALGELAIPAKHAVHWFRKDLRLNDNPTLRQALSGAISFRCIYILNTTAYEVSIAENKWRFQKNLINKT